MAYRNYVRELAGAIPRLPVLHAQNLIQRAWREILDMRTWSFLCQSADIYAPDIISVGSAAVVQWSEFVVLDPSAAAAVDLQAISFPPVPSPIVGVGRQFRRGGEAIYNIVAWDSGTRTLTLDRRYAETSAPSATYQIYRAYYAPPETDFLMYDAVWNPRVGYGIIRQALSVGQEKLNALDPTRSSQGDSYYLSPLVAGGRGDYPMVHEFYPHPTAQTVYRALYRRRGWALSDQQDIPVGFQEYLLMHKAYVHAYQWAQANIATYPELAQTNWVLLQTGKEKEFMASCRHAFRQDDELLPRLPVRIAKWYSYFPLGGQWAQSHALPLSSPSM